MRRRLAAVAGELGIATEPLYDRHDGYWEWDWPDGPSPGAVAAHLGEEVASRVRLRRRPGPRAAALAVVVEALTGTPAQRHLEAEDPTVAPDARTGALAEALSHLVERDYEADDPDALLARLRKAGGPVALLAPYTGTAADAETPLAMTPVEHLTTRYVFGTLGWEAAEAWRDHLCTPTDTASLARAAMGDPDADGPTRLAAVALLGALRAEMQALELAAMDRAVDGDASYTDLGRALGVSRQAAQQAHTRRRKTTPARLST